MTFEQWWAKNYDTRLRAIPIEDPSAAELKSFAAACWNAAIEEARRWSAAPRDRTDDTDLMANALKVTPIDGVIQKCSQ